MKELQFLRYYTVYSYIRVTPKGERSQIFNRHSAICFADLFVELPNDSPKGEYTVFVSTSIATLRKQRSNYCFLNKAEIIRFLKCIQHIIPEFTEFSIIPIKDAATSGYEIKVTIEACKKAVHKYVLTMIRYLYEPCFSLALYDATRLVKLPEFRFMSYANILNIVLACFPSSYPNYNSWHAVGSMIPLKFLTRKTIRERLEENRSLNGLFDTRGLDYVHIKETRLPETDDKYNLSFWESIQDFNNIRKPSYLKMLDLIKEG